MVEETLGSVTRTFLELLPPGDYSSDELLAKLNMVLKIQGVETKNSLVALRKAIHYKRKHGFKFESIQEKGKKLVYRKP